MICSKCERTFESFDDYMCKVCRGGRITARYDDEGYNQWGMRYHSVCKCCQAEYPANMYGMGTCKGCGTRNNPMR